MKVLFISHHKPLASFEKINVQLLKKYHQTKAMYLSGRGRFELVKFIPKLYWADIAVCHFADWHSYRSVMWCSRLGKKSVIIVGGYDVANEPDVPYGIAATRPGALPMVVQTLNQADLLIANSRFIKQEIIQRFKISPHKISMIYNGIDHTQFHPQPENTKEHLVLTVASINWETIKIKHLDLFIRSAANFPDCKFWVVGPCQDERALSKLKSLSPDNVSFIGPLYGQDLVKGYQRAKVYVQISLREGFGMALAEAMACGCVPVVTKKGALPEVVGNCGFYAEEGDLDSTVAGIRKALKAPYGAGLAARERIVREFPLERREQAISALVEKLCLANNH